LFVTAELASVTCALKANTLFVFGVPEMRPLEVSDKPAGRLGELLASCQV